MKISGPRTQARSNVPVERCSLLCVTQSHDETASLNHIGDEQNSFWDLLEGKRRKCVMSVLPKQQMENIVNHHLRKMAIEISANWEKAIPAWWRQNNAKFWYENCQIISTPQGFFAVTRYSYPEQFLLITAADVKDYLRDMYFDIRTLAQNNSDFRSYLCSTWWQRERQSRFILLEVCKNAFLGTGSFCAI